MVIGTTHMCNAILQTLKNHGWEILYAISEDPHVLGYCHANDIKTLDNLNKLKCSRFVLFSIINFQIINDSFLKSHKVQYAINYHDSLLPKYGGINSTTWAIHDKEKQHGVTWHLISSGIDEGGILAQSSFPINSEETAFDLNLKCCEEGIKLFSKILNDFEAYVQCAQKQDLSIKTYYGKDHIPKNYGLIDFRESFEEISRLQRALHFGTGEYCNPVASLKIWNGKNFFIVESMQYFQDNQSVSGYVYSTEGSFLSIGIKKGRLILTELMTLDGKKIPIKDAGFIRDTTITPYTINQREKKVLKRLRKSEAKLLKTLCFQKDRLLSYTPNKISLSVPREYQKKIQVVNQAINGVLSSVLLGASKFAEVVASIAVFSNVNRDYQSKFLRQFLFKQCSFKFVARVSSPNYHDLANTILKNIKNGQMIPRDLFHRYHTKPISSEGLVVIISNDEFVEEDFLLCPYRIRIIIGKDTVIIDGDKKDKSYIDAISFAILQGVGNETKNVSLVSTPDLQLIDLPCVSSTTSNKALQKAFPNFLEMFEKVAQRQPRSHAISFCQEWTSYGRLNEKANKFARYLRKLGVLPGSLIGVRLERSIDLITTLIGIMKAGCTYLPLDPKDPIERAKVILQNANIDCLITQTNLKGISVECKFGIILIDQVQCRISKEPNANLNLSKSASHVLYVIYTSGSTGEPKGVEILETAFNNVLSAFKAHTQCTAVDKWLALTTVSFDIAQVEILLPLTQGAKVIFATDAESKDPREIINLIVKNDITVMQSTPSRWQMLVDEEWAGKKGMIAISTGEALPRNLAKRLLESNVELWNMYGPTEITVWASMAKITSAEQAISIGQPIINTQFYVLNNDLKTQLNGRIGELYIGGAGLARGYRNNPWITREKFISTQYGKLYRTGDLVRCSDNGVIEYIGRSDCQIKIRGFRVELGEIEEALKKTPGVEQAIAATYEPNQGDIQIVAYFQGAVSQNDLKNVALKYLPIYMQPSRYIHLNTFPLTSNLKIDRKSLPSPLNYIESDSEHKEPENIFQMKIAKIFAQYLGRDWVDINANFFSLGGHSLLAVRVISEINTLFCVNLPYSIMFKHPSIRELSLQLESFLEWGSTVSPVTRYPKKHVYELSQAQLRIWYAHKVALCPSLYSVPQKLEILGHLDVQKFSKSIKIIVENHQILRAVLEENNGVVNQKILNWNEESFQYYDLSTLSNPKNIANTIIASEAQREFDFFKGPLSRFILLKLSPKRHELFFNIHHVIFDGLSTNILLKDLKRLYETPKLTKMDKTIDSLPQYVDYVTWEKANKRYPAEYDSLHTVVKKLKQVPLSISLPLNKKRPKQLTYDGNIVRFSIEKNKFRQIQALIKNCETTLYVFFLTVLHVLLSRYTSQKQFVIGTPVSGRSHNTLDSMIGCFINIILMPTSSEGNEVFRNLLNRFNRECSEMFMHQGVPFDLLTRELKAKRLLCGPSGFQVMLNILPEVAIDKLDNLEVSLDQVNRKKSHVDLSLTLQASRDCLTGFLEYNANLFTRNFTSDLSKHFKHLVDQVIKDPEQPVSQYQILTDQEILKCLADSSAQGIKYNNTLSIVESFESQSNKTPNAVAVICGRQKITYGDLNKKANQLAHTLVGKGIKLGDKVAICMKRSIDFIISVLGVLKAGATYIPIDPREPSDRIKIIIEELRPFCIIASQCIDRSSLRTNVIEISKINCSEYGNLCLQIPENQLAYIIFTSGSTGKPKGVEIEHRSINDRIQWKKASYPLTENDAVLHTYSFIFDGAIINYIWPLCTGAKLVITTESNQIDPDAIIQLICKHRISVIDMLPSLIHAILELDKFLKCKSLKYCFSGGESLSGEVVRAFYKKCHWATLYNTYGPTEATVEASVWECNSKFSGAVAPIGKPIGGAKLYILDGCLKLVPNNVQGELYIGGKGLAQAYLNDPQLTKLKFIKNPYAQGKIYRTGDLVRKNSNGDIEFIGRIDHQIKIRGFRVELGEIESALLHMDQVEKAAVKAKGASDQKRLIAYVQLSPRMEKTSFWPLMHHFLSKRLPSHMIPSEIIVLKKFPILLNGKTDYNSLPLPSKSVAAPCQEKPTCSNELKLLNIWKEILDYADLSVGDNFFEVGGNSLLAVRLISRINQELRIQIPLISIFHHSTIKALAAYIKNSAQDDYSSLTVPMQNKGEQPPFFCIHPVGGNVFCYRKLAKHWTDDRPLYAIRARGTEKGEHPLKLIRSMAREYIKAIKAIQPKGPYYIGGWSFGGHVAVEMARQLTLQGDQVKLLILMDTSTDIEQFRTTNVNDEDALCITLLQHYNIEHREIQQNMNAKDKLICLLESGCKEQSPHNKRRVERTLRVAKSNYRAIQKLQILPVANVPVVLLKAQNNPSNKFDLGWKDYVDELYVYEIPGDHWGLMDSKIAKEYVSKIKASIDAVHSKPPLVQLGA